MSAFWTVLIYSFLTVAGSDSFLLDRIDTTKEIYFRRIDTLQTYDFIIPIVYVVPIRESNQFFDRTADLIHLVGNFSEQKNNHAIIREYLNFRQNLISDFESGYTSSRSKRSIMGATNAIRDFFGDILVACCRVLTYRDGRKIVTNQNSLAEHYNILKTTMIDDHKNLFRVNEVISSMNKNLAQQTKIIKEKFRSIEETLKNSVNKDDFLNLMNEVHHQDFFQNLLNTLILETMRLTQIFSACKAHKATQSILSIDKLMEDLSKLEISSWKINYELVIDITKISEYYHSPLLDCNMHGNMLELELKVPIVRKNSKFEVFEIKPLPFFWESKICHVKIDSKLIISDTSSQILKSMTDSDLTACDINGKLCKIPQFRVINSFDSCITAIFREEPQTEIQTKCHFECEKSNPKEIVATQLSETSFALSNFQTLLAVDSLSGQKETAIFNKSFGGSYLLSVPCTTEILNINEAGGTQTIVPLGIPCFHSELDKLSLAKIIPFSWIKLETPSLTNFHQFKKENISNPEINLFWNESLYKLNNVENPNNLTKKLNDLVLQQIDLGKQETFSLVHILFIVWLSIVSFLILVILYYLWHVGDPAKLVNIGTDLLTNEIENLKASIMNERAVN